MTDQPKKGAFSQWDERLSSLLRDYKDYSSSDSRQKSYSEFLRASFREIMILHEDFAIYKYPTVERALQSLLRDWRMVDEKRFEPDGRECIPRYVPMEADGGSVEPVLAEGIRYYENVSDGRKMIIRIELLEDPEGIEFMARAWFVIKREEMEFLRTLLREIGDWAKKNHHLKGKKIKPDGSLLKIPRTYSFDDIVLSDEIRGEIEENILDFFKKRESFLRNELPRKRGMILYGEPGVGKTLLGKVLCSQIDCTFIWVTPSRMSVPIEVSHLFEMARELSPTIIFMEDLDFYASNRSEYGGGNVRILGEVLNQMDGFEENGDVVVIGTTNDIESIEPALKDRPSRFDRVLELKLPELEDRKKLLRRYLRGHEADQIIDEIAPKMGGYNGAQINELVILAKKEALRQGEKDEMGIAQLKVQYFEMAISKMKKKKEFILGFKSE